MKGPYERLKYDLRRVWECPRCQGRQRTDGTTTALVCDCQQSLVENERVSMRLLRDGIRRSSVEQPKPSTPRDPASEKKQSATDDHSANSTEKMASDDPAEETTTKAAGEEQIGGAENEAATNTGDQDSQNTAPSESDDQASSTG